LDVGCGGPAAILGGYEIARLIAFALSPTQANSSRALLESTSAAEKPRPLPRLIEQSGGKHTFSLVTNRSRVSQPGCQAINVLGRS
jgi:hypothetical protein